MKYLVFFCLVLLCSGIYAQNAWFEDNFNDKSRGWLWSDYDGPEITRKIDEGKYSIDHKNNQVYWTLVGIWTDRNKDYSIESNILLTEGGENNGSGIIISGSDSKYFYFIINPTTESFWVGTEQKGTWITLNKKKDWEKSTAVNKRSVSNKLMVLKKGENMIFLINDQEVYNGVIETNFKEALNAEYFGIVTCAPMKIEIDNFILKQDNVLNLAPNLPRGLQKVNLGPNVNSEYVEKTPLISHDGKTLYFTVQGAPTNIANSDDIYYSTSSSDTIWSPRTAAGFPLNNSWPNSVISVSPDNNSLILMHRYNADGTPKESGISISNRTKEGWSVPQDIIVENYYNKGGSNEYCLSADRKVLLMAVERDDTYGLNDIYVSFLKDDGTYTKPKNLGNVVNTSAWEVTPFLAADGVSLYFATAGHPGYGNVDIFVTKRLDSTWTNWSVPQNMGPDINSMGWDAYFSIPASGAYAYVVSNNESLGAIDVFRVKLPDALKPKPVVLIYGKVLNSKTNAPLEANIAYNILSTNKEAGIAISNVNDGSYKIVLPAGEAYSFLASKENFYSVGENIDLKDLKAYKEIERNLYLAPIEVGETIRLNNLFFDFNKSNLRAESFAELDRVVKLLNEVPSMEIEIAGHTDNVGDDLYNKKLSEDRANAVRNYLLGKGIAASRIISKGYGESKPVSANTTDAGRQQNRRVEFTILKK